MPFIFEIVFGGARLIIAILLFIAVISARQNQRFFREAIPLMAATISFFWIVAALIWHGALGPSYSAFRYSIIALNMFGMVFAAVIATFVKAQRSWATDPAALILACIWLYIGAINSVAG